ncbi:MAG: hypothetical protein RR022_01340 [Angelakisella sp.]
MRLDSSRIIILCGHYGSGKTNLSVNLALLQAQQGRQVSVCDLDIVNPYFRTADFGELFSAHGIELIAPCYANSNLDTPILPPRLAAAIGDRSRTLVIDVGGDDDGAVALGGYSQRLNEAGCTVWYVVNRRRYLEPDVEGELALLQGVERCSRLRVTGLVNNTNLGGETTASTVQQSRGYLDELAQRSGLPVVCTAVDRRLTAELGEVPHLLPVDIYVKTPW